MRSAADNGYKSGQKGGLRRDASLSISPVRDSEEILRESVSMGQEINEDKHAEAELRESETRYRLLFKRNLAGFFRGKFRSGALLDCNDAYARILGFESSREALATGRLQEFCDPSEAVHARSCLLEESVLTNFETRFWRRDRTEVWVIANASLVESGDKEDPFIEGTLFDISKRKQAERALSRERDLLCALMDNIPDYIYFKDKDSRFVRANKALARSFGIGRPADLAGKTDFDFFTAEHAEQAYADEQEVIRTGNAIVAKEERETWPDGRVTWVSTTKLPLLDASGNAVGTLGVSRDITERKLAEERTRLQTAALESAANGIAITDLKGRALWVNPAFASLTGYSSDEMVGETMRLLKSGEHDSRFYETLWTTILSGQVWQGEIINRRKDGTLYTDFTTITPVPDSQGRFTHFVAVKQDATGRHRAQKALEERTAYLNTLVEISPYAVVVLSMDKRIQMTNSAFERLFLYSREEILGANLVGSPGTELEFAL